MPASPEDGAQLAARVAALAAEAEVALLRRIAEQLALGIDQPEWEQRKLAELQLLMARVRAGATALDEQLAEAIRQEVLAAYNTGGALAAADLDDLNVTPAPTPTPISTAGGYANTAAAAASSAAQQLPGALERLYRDAINAGAREVLGGTVTRRQAAQAVLDRLGGHGVTGYRDKAGRAWSLTSYVEMAVRTATGQAAVQGHVDSLAAAGVDLVLVSDAPRECPLCRPFEGKVLSISGQVGAVIVPSATTGSPVTVRVHASVQQARADGLQHPNCRHSLSAFLPGATRKVPARSDPDGYEQGQRQRQLERKVREWKRRQAVALDGDTAARAASKVRAWQTALREHVDAHDLKRLRYREQIARAI